MSKAKTFLLLALGFLFIGISLLLLHSSRPQTIPWTRDYDRALESARREEKAVIAYLFTDWCTYCQKMEQETFSNRLIMQNIGGRYVWLKLNAETDEQGIRLRQTFGLTGYPTTYILDAQGREIDRIEGYLPAEKFAQTLQQAIDGPDSFGRIQERALQNPDSAEAQFELAQRLLQRQDFQRARERFIRVLALDPQNHSEKTDASHFYLALALASLEEREQALARLRTLEQTFPESEWLPEAALLRGQIHFFAGEEQKAGEVFEHFLERYPEHFYTRQIRGMLSEIPQR